MTSSHGYSLLNAAGQNHLYMLISFLSFTTADRVNAPAIGDMSYLIYFDQAD
jgi:hypothetical protein